MRKLTLFVAVALLAVACSEKQGSFGKPGQAVKVEWMTDTTFQPVNQRHGEGGHGEVMLSGGQYAVSLDGFPVGSGWQIGDRKGQLENVERDVIDVADVSGQLGQLEYGNPDLSLAEIKVDATLVLDIKGGGRMEVKLPPAQVGEAVSKLLNSATTAAVIFAGEPADATPLENVLLLHGAVSEWKLIGPAKLVQDIDAVAETRWLPEVKGKTECIGYQTGGTGTASKSFPLEFRDTEVVIHDRRTGKLLETKVLPAEEVCPEQVIRKEDDPPLQVSASPLAIQAFVEVWLASKSNQAH